MLSVAYIAYLAFVVIVPPFSESLNKTSPPSITKLTFSIECPFKSNDNFLVIVNSNESESFIILDFKTQLYWLLTQFFNSSILLTSNAEMLFTTPKHENTIIINLINLLNINPPSI